MANSHRLLLIFLPLLCAAAPADRVQFDHPHALCNEPFDLRLSSTAREATIVYALDDSLPAADHGATYRDPIRVTTTSVIRAAVVVGNSLASPVETCSYVFPDDVARQNGNGLPTSWGENDGKPVPSSYTLRASPDA